MLASKQNQRFGRFSRLLLGVFSRLLLGVFLDYELNFSDHVTHVCKRASRQLNPVRRVAKYLNKDCLMKLFHAFIIFNFSYCAIVWHFCSKSSTIKMEKMRKAALRVVFNDYDADYNKLLSMSERSPLLVVRLQIKSNQISLLLCISVNTTEYKCRLFEVHYCVNPQITWLNNVLKSCWRKEWWKNQYFEFSKV